LSVKGTRKGDKVVVRRTLTNRQAVESHGDGDGLEWDAARQAAQYRLHGVALRLLTVDHELPLQLHRLLSHTALWSGEEESGTMLNVLTKISSFSVYLHRLLSCTPPSGYEWVNVRQYCKPLWIKVLNKCNPFTIYHHVTAAFLHQG